MIDIYHNGEMYTPIKNLQKAKNRIKELEAELEKVYEVGQEGIAYVGAANYAEREAKARSDLSAAYYDEIYTDT